MSVELKDWNDILEKLVQGKIDQDYITHHIDPLLKSTDLLSYIDSLGECLLFYSIVYQNELLLNRLLEQTHYSSKPVEAWENVRKSVFRGIKQLSYNFAKHDQFIIDTIQKIADSSLYQFLLDCLNDGLIADIFEHVMPREKKSLEHMQAIMTILEGSPMSKDEAVRYTELKELYETLARGLLWNHYGMRNFIKNPSFDLKYLNYEFFHFAAERRLHNQIETFNIIKIPEFLLKKNSGGENVLLLLFKKGAYDFLSRNLQTMGHTLNASNDKLKQINNRNETFLHLLIRNKRMNFQEKIMILQSLDSNWNLKEYSKIADNNQLTPLALFILKFSKEVQKDSSQLQTVLKLLTPEVSLKPSTEILPQVQRYVALKQMGIKLTKEEIDEYHKQNRDQLIYNEKLIKICMDLRAEKLLINLLENIPYLNLNSFYTENLGTVKHLVCIAAEKNLKEVLKWYCNKKTGQEPCFLAIDLKSVLQKDQNQVKDFLVGSNEIYRYSNYSVFDEIIDLVNQPSFKELEEDTKSALLDNFEKMWNKISSKEQSNALLNFSFTNRLKRLPRRTFEKPDPGMPAVECLRIVNWPEVFINKVLKANNSRLLKLLESSISKLKEVKIEDDVKKAILFSSIESKTLSLFKGSPIEALVRIDGLNQSSPDKGKDTDTDNLKTELFNLCGIVSKSPGSITEITNYYPLFKDHLFTGEFISNLETHHLSKKEDTELSKSLAGVFVSYVLHADFAEKSSEDNRFLQRLFTNEFIPRVLRKLPEEIIREIIQLKRLKDIYSKLESTEMFNGNKLLRVWCLYYLKCSEEDIYFEKELFELYQKYLLSEDFRCEVTIYSCTLKQIAKIARFALNNWKIVVVNFDSLIKSIKKQKIKTQEILYLPLLDAFSGDYVHSYALELCKKQAKEVEIVKSVYRSLKKFRYAKNFSFKGVSNAFLLEYAIDTLDIKGVESVIEQKIYDPLEIDLISELIRKVLFLFDEFRKPRNEQKFATINQILRYVLASHQPASKNDLVKVQSFHFFKYLPSLNLELFSFKDCFNVDWRSSEEEEQEMESIVRDETRMKNYIAALFKQKSEMLKKRIPELIEISKKLQGLDHHLFSNIHLLFKKDKCQFVLEIFKSCLKGAESTQPAQFLKYCLINERSLVEPTVKILVEKQNYYVDSIVLQELKVVSPKQYHTYILDRELGDSEKLDCIRSFLELEANDLAAIIDYFKKIRKENLANIFAQTDIAKALGLNGLHKKIEILLELGNFVIKDDPENKHAVLKWASKAFKYSCKMQELISAEKITHYSNIFDLRYIILSKDKNIDPAIISKGEICRKPPPSCFRFLTHESECVKRFHADVKKWGVQVGPLTEKRFRPIVGVAPTTKSQKIQEKQERRRQQLWKKDPNYNIYGFEIKDSSSIVNPTQKVEKKTEQKSEVGKELVKKVFNPMLARTFFAPYSKGWGSYNDKDVRDLAQTITKTLTFLSGYLIPGAQDKSSKEDKEAMKSRYEKMLLIGVKANIILVEKTLSKYLDSLAQGEFRRYSEFYLRVLITFFEHASTFMIYKKVSRNKVHSVYQKEGELIISLFSHLGKINKKTKMKLTIAEKLLSELIRAIYFYKNLNIAQAFCKAVSEGFPNDTLGKDFGISKTKVLSIFLGLCVELRSANHFISITRLEPSINTITFLNNISRIQNKEEEGEEEGEDEEEGGGGGGEEEEGKQQEVLNQTNDGILRTLIRKNLWKFVVEYDKLKGNKLLLEPLEVDVPESQADLSARNSKKQTGLQMAIKAGATEAVQPYLVKLSLSDHTSVYSKNFQLFETVVKKIYANDPAKMFAYIKDNQILLKVFRTNPSEKFVMNIFTEFIMNPKPNLILSIEAFKTKDKYGWTLFHYIAFNRMSQLFYLVLKYIQEIVCQNKQQMFKDSIELLLNEPASAPGGSKQDLNQQPGGEEEEENDGQPMDLVSPLEYAFMTRFYEMTCFADEYGIKPKEIRKSYLKLSGRFRFSFSGDLSDQTQFDKTLEKMSKDKENKFSTLFIESVKAFLKTIRLVQTIKGKSIAEFPGQWEDLIEDIYFTPHYMVSKDHGDKIFNLKSIRGLMLDGLLARLHPEIMPGLLYESEIIHMNPSLLVYLIDKSCEIAGAKRSTHLKDLYQKYVLEIKNKDQTKPFGSFSLLEKMWVDQDLENSVLRLREILQVEEKEAKVLRDSNILKLSNKQFIHLADKCYSRNSLFALKALILIYPEYVFAMPEHNGDEANHAEEFKFWSHLTLNPGFMCYVLSLLDAEAFDSFVIKNIEQLLNLYNNQDNQSKEFHTTKSLAWCLYYIAFSLRGDKHRLLSKENLPDFVKKITAQLFNSSSPRKCFKANTIVHFFQNLLECFLSREFTHKRMENLTNQKSVLLKICSDLGKLLKPLITSEETIADAEDGSNEDTVKPGVFIEDTGIDKNLETCVNFLISTLNTEENPLIIYVNALLTGTRLFSLIQEIADLGEKFQYVINLSLSGSSDINSVGMKVREVDPNKLNVTVVYCLKYDSNNKTVSLVWENRDRSEVEHEIDSLCILRNIKEKIEKNLKSIEGSIVELPTFDYESLTEVSYQEKSDLINAEYFLEQAYKTYFGILPFLKDLNSLLNSERQDKPQLNEIEENLPLLSQSKNNQKLVMHEFYSICFPSIESFVIRYSQPQAFKEKKAKASSLENLIKAFKFYENKAVEFSQKGEQELKDMKMSNVEWSIGGSPLSYCFESPYDQVLRYRDIIKLFKSKISMFSKQGLSKFRWEMNTVSFLEEIIFNLTKAIRSCLLSSEGKNPPRISQLLDSYKKRNDDVFNVIANYLDCSIFKKVMSIIIHAFVMDSLQITSTYAGYYVVFEKVSPAQGAKQMDPKHFHLFDRIIQYTQVKLEVVNKVILVKFQYCVNNISIKDLEAYTRLEINSKDVLQSNPLTQEYLDGLFNKYDIYSTLVQPRPLVDIILSKKTIDDALISLSKKISEQMKKQVNFTIDYHQIYHLCEPFLEKTNKSRADLKANYMKVEKRLAVLRSFILRNLPLIIENSIFSDIYMDQLLAKVQIQNYLYRNKKPLNEFLKENVLSIDTYPAEDSDFILTHSITNLNEIRNDKFLFLIHINRSLAVSNAVVGQRYLICLPNEVLHVKVTETTALPYHDNGYYLLMSATWPDLEFCSYQVNSVLILDGKNRIVDITKSCLKELIHSLQTEDMPAFTKTQSYLINKAFRPETEVTVHNLFPLYPTLISLNLKTLNINKESETELQNLPSLKNLRSSIGSQIFENQKTIDLFFVNETKIEMAPLVPDDLKYSQKIKASLDFQTSLSEFRSQIRRMLTNLKIKEQADRIKLALLKMLFGIDPLVEETIRMPFDKFNQEIRVLLDHVVQVLEATICLQKVDNINIQQTVTLLYDDIYMEDDIIAFRKLLSLCQTMQRVELYITKDSKEQSLFFDLNTRTWRIIVDFNEEKQKIGALNYPSHAEMLAFLNKLLLKEEIKRTQASLNPQNNTLNADLSSILVKIKQNISQKVDIELNIDNAQLQIESHLHLALLFMDVLLWKLASSIQLLSLSEPEVLAGLKRLQIQISNKKEDVEPFKVKLSQAQTNEKTLNIIMNATGCLEVLISNSQDIYILFWNQIKLKNAQDPMLNWKIKPLDDLTFTFNKNTQKIERKFVIDVTSEADNTFIGATFLGIRDLKTYPCSRTELSHEENLKPSERVLRVLVDQGLPPQNYYICFVVDKKSLLRPLLSNVYNSEGGQYMTIAQAMAQQAKISGNLQVDALIEEPFYLVAEFKKKNVDVSTQLREASHYIDFFAEEKNGKNCRSVMEAEEDYKKKGNKPLFDFIQHKSKLLDETKLFYKLAISKSNLVRVRANKDLISFPASDDPTKVDIKLFASEKIALEKTRVIGPNNTEYRNSIKSAQLQKKKRTDLNSNQYRSIYEHLSVLERIVKANLVQDDKVVVTTEKDLETKFMKTFQDTNFILNIQNDEYWSITGQERVETLKFSNKNGADALVMAKEALNFSILFVHNRSSKIKFKGEISQKTGGDFIVKWKPLIKGSYSLFINSKIVSCANNLIVLAGPSSEKNSTFRWPEIKSYAYYDKINFEAEFRDKFGNRLNQVEVEKHHSDNAIQVEVSATDVIKKLRFEKVRPNGIQIGEVTISPKNMDEVFANCELALTFLMDGKELYTLIFQILGFGFKKRLDLFYNDVRHYGNGNGYSVKVSRGNFFKDLLEIPLENFKAVYHVDFIGEAGIDAGGLKREFWELAGKEFKSSKSKIFAGTNDRYFLSYNYTMNEKTEKSLKLFGALLAGSILNKQFLGVNFGPSFQKGLFGQPFEREDLKEIFGDQVYINYISLVDMSDQDLDSLEQYFEATLGEKSYELIPGGSQIKVNKQNVNRFLDSLVEFYLVEYQKKAWELIKEGFNKVFPLTELRKWFVYSDLPLLTYGTLNVTGDNILSFIKFSGGSTTLVQFFTQFLTEANPELLRDFLKFVTGSSALPYDDPFYSLLVTFENRDSSKLPTSHTCSKHLEVPKYRSYEQMKKMLTIAFVNASEGFGFA